MYQNEELLGEAMIHILSFAIPTYPIKFCASYISHYENVVLHLDFLQKALKYAQDFANYNTKLASRYVQHTELIDGLLERVNNAINECNNETERH